MPTAQADRETAEEQSMDAERADGEAAKRFLAAERPLAMAGLRLAVAASVVGGMLVVAQALLVAASIDAVTVRGGALGDIAWQLALLTAVVGLRAAAIWTSERAAQQAGAAVKRSLRSRIVARAIELGPVALAAVPVGRLVAAATDSLQAIEPYYSRYLPAARLAAITPLLVLAVVAALDWVSALVLVVTAPLIPVFMVLIGDGTERVNRRQWTKLTRMSGHFLDVIQGLATLKALSASRREAQRVARVADDYRRDTMAVLRIAFLSSFALEFFATIAIALVAVLIGFRLMWGELAFFNGLAALLLTPELFLPLRALGTAYHARLEAIGAAGAIAEFLERPPVASMSGGKPGHEQLVSRPSADHRGIAIAFEDVHVAFPGGRIGLSGLSLKIAAGARVAIVGPSGAGKSTLLNVLLGFVAPAGGRVLVDGVPLGEIDLAAWRRLVAYLPQRAHMFDTTIARNIAMVLDGDSIDERRVVEAARRAHAYDFVMRLPDGFATHVGERGAGLSGGEVQRLALARAFYRDCPVVLMDEAAAHLDRASEAAVAAVIPHLAAGRTLVSVAHRLGSARDADRILVLDGGCLDEDGSHAELIANGGLYARLWREYAHTPQELAVP